MYTKNTTGLSDQAAVAESFYSSRLKTETYEGSILREGLKQNMIDDVLRAKAAEFGERGTYGIHVILDMGNKPASAISEQAKLLDSFMGLKFKRGGWKPGEQGGYQGTVGWYTLIYISRLGTLREICHLIGSK